MAVLRVRMAKLDGSGSSITTVASGHSSLNRMVEKPAFAPVRQERQAAEAVSMPEQAAAASNARQVGKAGIVTGVGACEADMERSMTCGTRWKYTAQT